MTKANKSIWTYYCAAGVIRYYSLWMYYKENKLDYFEHKHIFCFKLQCSSIVYLLCTGDKSKDVVVHCEMNKRDWGHATFYKIVYPQPHFRSSTVNTRCVQNFAYDLIRTAVLWLWKQPHFQLSHNYCPGSVILLETFFCNNNNDDDDIELSTFSSRTTPNDVIIIIGVVVVPYKECKRRKRCLRFVLICNIVSPSRSASLMHSHTYLLT